MDLGSIIGSIGAAASGGIFGLLGSGIGVIAKHYQQKQAHQQNIELMDMQLKVKSQEGSWSGLVASSQSDVSSSNTHAWANDIRALYRPFLTTILLIVSYLIFRDILSGLSNKESTLADIFTGSELKNILRYIVYSLVFATCTAVVWWFGDRAFAPPGLVNR